MDDRLALHTAARRYCIDLAPALDPIWRRRYEDEHPDRKTSEDFFAANGGCERFWTLGDLLKEIESVQPREFATVELLREYLLDTASETPDDLAKRNAAMSSRSELRKRRARPEMVLFRDYIERLSDSDLRTVEPLPLRRRLAAWEGRLIWHRLRREWNVPLYGEGQWDPVAQATPHPVVVFDSYWFDRYVPPDTLRSLLAGCGVDRVWMLLEENHTDQLEMDLELLVLVGPTEQYWTSEKLDWIIYESSNWSITVGGEHLLEEVKRVWPEWQKGIDTGRPAAETESDVL